MLLKIHLLLGLIFADSTVIGQVFLHVHSLVVFLDGIFRAEIRAANVAGVSLPILNMSLSVYLKSLLCREDFVADVAHETLAGVHTKMRL